MLRWEHKKNLIVKGNVGKSLFVQDVPALRDFQESPSLHFDPGVQVNREVQKDIQRSYKFLVGSFDL